MEREFEDLARMEYPGRVIVIGTSPKGYGIVMYAITGRSPSSQARMLEIDADQTRILVKPTDEETLKSGDPDLLIYPAIIIGEGIAVSNGKQTADITPLFKEKKKPTDILASALSGWSYEPDEPNYTPRISGCLFNGAALSIIKRADDGSAMRNYFEIPLTPGRGRMIATYTGINENPLPSFAGEPVDVILSSDNADTAVAAFYEALGPADGGKDFRVAAAAVYRTTDGSISAAIRNRHEL